VPFKGKNRPILAEKRTKFAIFENPFVAFSFSTVISFSRTLLSPEGS